MRNFRNKCFYFLVCILPLFLTGCFEDEIIFRGKVFWATVEYIPVGSEIKEILIVQGPVDGAMVKEANHTEVVVTDSNGNYELTIEVPRVIGLPKAKTYIVQAWSPVWSPTPIKPGADEYITRYANARPGDTVEVRSFVLYEHTHEVNLE